MSNLTFGQSVADLIDAVSKEGILANLRAFSGEDSTTVSGNKVIIQHRVSSKNNDLAAAYLKEQLSSRGLSVNEISFGTNGRNIVAKQLGSVNPANIHIICAHYDSVNDHGADDNASGTVAVLEAARILSQYNFENTIIYALWDEEEIGLKGSKDYAQKASNSNENILSVLNMDMMAYDSDNDHQFDIDVRDIANSYEIRDELINLVSTYNLDLKSKVVDPGTPDSDHFSFWNVGYSAILLGEAWSVNDITPGYHTANDRISLINMDYYFEMVKLSVGYIASNGILKSSSIPELLDTSKVIIFPNPSSNSLNIDLGVSIKGNVSIINIAGIKVQLAKVDGQYIQLEIGDLLSGTYYIKIDNEEGTSSTFEFSKN